MRKTFQRGRFLVLLSSDNTKNRPLWLILLIVCRLCQAATISESFVSDPAIRGWQSFGVTNLFAWNTTNQNLAVTWDSSKSNSYFFIPVQTILAGSDDFSIALDLYLNDVTAGIDPSKPSTF